MKSVSLNNEKGFGEAVLAASEVLKNGGVVCYPSETCYGLLADFNNPEAVRKVFALKQRPEEKKLLVLVRSGEEVRKLVRMTEAGERLAKKFWPGPLTLVLPYKEETLAVRVPQHKFSQALLEECGLVLVSTSANVSGEEAVYEAGEVTIEADLLINGGRIPEQKPTTLVDCTVVPMQILRQGELTEEEIFDEGEDAGRSAENN